MTQRKLTGNSRQRAARCLQALSAYSQDDAFTTLTDFLADAMHFCDVTEHSFEQALAQSCRHYLHEIIDERRYERRTFHD